MKPDPAMGSLCLKWGTVTLFTGKVLLSAFGMPSVVEFTGYESWFGPVVRLFMPWEAYATDIYPGFSECLAWLWTLVYLLAVVGIFLGRRGRIWVAVGGIFLFMEVLMGLAGEYFWLGGLLEKTLIWATPWVYLAWQEPLSRHWARVYDGGRMAVGLVFLAHGAMALQWVPRPGYWLELVMMTTGWSEQVAHPFLLMVGVLDLIAGLIVIGIRFPHAAFWVYLSTWGLLTALARISGFLPDGRLSDLVIVWGPEMLIRLPHGLVPLALWGWISRVKDPGSQPSATGQD